jgi:hypothetical protein
MTCNSGSDRTMAKTLESLHRKYVDILHRADADGPDHCNLHLSTFFSQAGVPSRDYMRQGG